MIRKKDLCAAVTLKFLTVFEKDKEQWRGVTTFPAQLYEGKQIKDEYVNEQRNGFLAYKKRQVK